MVNFLLGFAFAVVLYAVYRFARDLWYELELDIMAHEMRAERRKGNE